MRLHHAGDFVLISLTPDGLRLRLDTALSSQNGHRTVQDAQGTLDLNSKVHVARGVDDVDAVTVLLECNRILLGLRVAPVAGGSSGSDGSTMELRADFGRMLPRLKQGRLQQELLVKAARTKGIESPGAIDATAGFGEDSLLLAAAGFAVDLYEQDCVIAALLKDALDRAADDPALATAVARMRL